MPVDARSQSRTDPATSTARSSASRRRGKNRDEAWKLVKYLTTNDHALAKFSNGIRNVPSTRELDEVAGAQAGRELRHVPEAVHEPEVDDDPDHPDRCRTTSRRSRTSSPSGRPARSRTSRRVSPRSTSRSTRRSKQAGRRRGRRAVSSLPVSRRPGLRPRLAGSSIAGGPGGAQAWRRRLTVLAFLSPWLVGFAIFFGYPLVMTAYLSFTHYDLLSPPRWVGLANYRYLFGAGRPDLAGGREHARGSSRSSVPLQVLFAFGIAVMLTRAKAGRRGLPDGLLPPGARAAGRGDARVRLPPEPGDRARSTRSSAGSGSKGRSGSTTRRGRSRRS